MTIKEIVKDYIDTSSRKYFSDGIVEIYCWSYALDNYGIMHEPGSYSRLFREVRNELGMKEVTEDLRGRKFKYKTWAKNEHKTN